MKVQKAEEQRVVVVGSGFGGLAAALKLANAGLKPLVLERLSYPGGCASTFERGGNRFETGATLFSGFAAGQLFRRWIDDQVLDVNYQLMAPVIQLRSPELKIDIGPSREAFVAAMKAAVDDAGLREQLDAFFREQAEAARTLWTLIDAPEALLPLESGGLRKHLSLILGYLRLLPILGKSLRQRLEHYGLAGHPHLGLIADAMGQITLQGSATAIEAAMAMATLEYPFRGAAHIQGGVGELARAMVRAIVKRGGELRYSSELRGLKREGDHWQLALKTGTIRAQEVVANLVPAALRALCPGTEFRDLDWREAALQESWSACMHYLIADEPLDAPPGALHFQLIADPNSALVEGNHVFVSISSADDGMAPSGKRSLTMSTHIALSGLRDLAENEQAQLVAQVQARMLRTFAELVPDWSSGLRVGHKASPRTFRRFLSRPQGMVGGIPRLAGFKSYRGLKPCRPASGLWLVGDSVFPGQSILATTIGGLKAARDLLNRSK